MALTWKDGLATLLVSGVVFITYSKAVGWNLPLLSSWRLATLAIFVLGMATCIAVGSGIELETNTWSFVGSLLGMIALALLIIGLISDSSLIFYLLAADIVALWVLTTAHHLTTPAL